MKSLVTALRWVLTAVASLTLLGVASVLLVAVLPGLVLGDWAMAWHDRAKRRVEGESP